MELEALEFAWKTAVWLSRHRERARWWQQVGELCGLTNVVSRRALGWNWAMEGRAGPLRVRLESFLPRRDVLGANIVIEGLPGEYLAPESDLAHRSNGDRLFGANDLDHEEVDIPPLVGPPLLLCAVLGPDTRRLVRNLFAGRIDVDGKVRTWESDVRIEGGTLRAPFQSLPETTLHDMADALGALLDIARRLLPPPDLERAVADRVLTDPQVPARVHHLRTLIARGKDAELREETLATAMDNEAAEVRLAAALEAGERGRPVLLAITAAEEAPDACRAQAVTALGPHLPTESARSTLGQALRAGRMKTAAASIGLLASRGPSELEPTLLEALERAGEVRRAAVEALARVGTVAAVLPLRELEREYPREKELLRACRAAVSAIQSRLTHAAQGQLQVADTDAGALSLAEDERGRVALEEPAPDPPRGS